MRARELVAERRQGLLGRAFSHVFGLPTNRDSHFDFNVVLPPVPTVIQDNLARWVDDHVDAMVEEFAPEDDTVVIVDREDGAGSNDKEDH